MAVLETAMKIANQDADAEDDEEEGPAEAAKVKIPGEPNLESLGFVSWCSEPPVFRRIIRRVQ